MKRVLIPVDGLDCSLRAVEHLLAKRSRLREPEELKIHLRNVQYPIRGDASLFVGDEQIKRYHREEGEKALVRARGLLMRSVAMKVLHLTNVPVLYVN